MKGLRGGFGDAGCAQVLDEGSCKHRCVLFLGNGTACFVTVVSHFNDIPLFRALQRNRCNLIKWMGFPDL